MQEWQANQSRLAQIMSEAQVAIGAGNIAEAERLENGAQRVRGLMDQNLGNIVYNNFHRLNNAIEGTET